MKIIEKIKLRTKTVITVKLNVSLIYKLLFSLKIIYIAAPKITGMLKRLEYFTVNLLLKPIALKAIILAPALLTPGTNAKH
tara:strand:+ start:96 stop:338 length:243 start_codon:yes stop_codon:yes gene_type:complete